MQYLLYRSIDILLSLTGIFTCLPVALIIYTLVLFDTGSPLFFQQRVGRDQKLFTLIKFRTMPVNTASVGTHLIDQTKITKLGSVLRKSKLDELPQLLNVLTGKMSFVGPRPCLPTQKRLVVERSQRGVFKVCPGITGLAQIHNVDMSTPRKLARYDALMIKSMSLRLYLGLITQTILGKGRGDKVHTAG